MIVNVVARVDTCMECPNLEGQAINHSRDQKWRYICNASRKIIASDYDMSGVLIINNRTHDSCPFAKDEVNRRPERER